MSAQRWRIKATTPSGRSFLGEYVEDVDAWHRAEPVRALMRREGDSYLKLVPVDDDGNELPARDAARAEAQQGHTS